MLQKECKPVKELLKRDNNIINTFYKQLSVLLEKMNRNIRYIEKVKLILSQRKAIMGNSFLSIVTV